jgi:transcriptional regulator with XRE-family HTH domain
MVERLIHLRKVLNLSQIKFAEKIGVSQALIWKVETDKRNFSTKLINAICNKLGVSREWLETGAGEMFAETSENALDVLQSKFGLDDFDKEIVYHFVNSPPAFRSFVKNYVKTIYENCAEKGIVPPSPSPKLADFPEQTPDSYRTINGLTEEETVAEAVAQAARQAEEQARAKFRALKENAVNNA